MDRDVEFEDGLGLAAEIRAGRITAQAALAAAVARAESVKDLGAIRHLDATGAEASARPNGDGPAPPFEGVPFLMKDLGVAVRGMPTVWGSLALRNRRGPAERDDAITARMRGAGLRIFGMTTICEFGQAPATEPAIGPVARNPLDPTRTPGGSSGGAAVAVASGIVALAHANDAAGSIRIPAACCGLVGLKPTRGATPWGPDFENFAAGYVSDFVVSRSLRDTAALLDAVAGRAGNPVPDPVIGPALARLDDTAAPLRIGLLLDGPDGAPIAAERRDAVAAAADVLAAAGHTVVPLDPSVVGSLNATAAHAVGVILSSGLVRIIDGLEPPLAAGELEPLTLATYRYGRGHSGAAVVEALIGGAKVAAGMAAMFEWVDVLLTPMLGTAPPPLGSFPTDHDDTVGHNRRMGAFVPYGLLPNVAGLPALTLPHGADDTGLPLPVQLIGAMGADVLLLQLGRTLQRALPWSFATPLAGSSVAGPMRL